MSDNKVEQNNSVTEGLPDLDNPPKKKGTNKKSPIGFLAGLLGVLSMVGFGVQYGIDHFGLFEKEPLVIEEPPVPEFSDNALSDSSGENFEINGSVSNIASNINTDSGIVQQEGEQIGLPSEHIDSINNSLSKLTGEVDIISGQLNETRGTLVNMIKVQNDLLKQLKMEMAMRESAEKKLTINVKENQRWLGGISNQLKDIGIDVKEASLKFPIVVYSKNVWGDDVFLTIAQKVSPEQTSFLRVGGVVGRWRLVEIHENKALFEHFEGNKKEVLL